MKKFVIFGNPVAHSKSPQMHNAAFKFSGFDGSYDKFLLEDGVQIKNVFLENNFSGANITVPHKEIAFEQADEVRGIASQIGAINTYILEDGKVVAYNTDAPGFIKAIQSFGEIRNVLILGAGGTAKAIATALVQNGQKVTVVNRSVQKLEYFKNFGCDTFDWCGLNKYDFDLVVNSTSAGLKDEEFPMPPKLLEGILKRSKNAFDCIYGKVTPFLKLAKEIGLNCKDGEDMLLFQGVLAWEYFTKLSADEKVINIMRDALKNHI